jgi:DNA-binding transcriptional MocR family regulator
MRRDAQAALESAGLEFDAMPDGPVGGIFLWARVPAAVSVDSLVRAAREKSILLANGSLFSPERVNNGRLRFNAAYSTAPELVLFLSASVQTGSPQKPGGPEEPRLRAAAIELRSKPRGD